MNGPLTLAVVGAALTLTAALYGIATTEDPNPDREYCEMVRVYQQTQGEYGWPPYKGTAYTARVCTDTQGERP